MTAPIDKVRGEGNCGRVTDPGEKARECVRKHPPESHRRRWPLPDSAFSDSVSIAQSARHIVDLQEEPAFPVVPLAKGVP